MGRGRRSGPLSNQRIGDPFRQPVPTRRMVIKEKDRPYLKKNMSWEKRKSTYPRRRSINSSQWCFLLQAIAGKKRNLKFVDFASAIVGMLDS